VLLLTFSEGVSWTALGIFGFLVQGATQSIGRGTYCSRAQALYVALPTAEGRASILCALVRKTPLAPEVDVAAIAGHARCSGFTGADLAALVREACVASLKASQPASDSTIAAQSLGRVV
jgi:AAA+ lid domain